MCSRSAIGDDFSRRHQDILHQWQPFVTPPAVTRAEFDALRAEIAELKKLLKAAKRFDEATGQADCDDAEKFALIKKLADFVGIDLSDVLSEKPAKPRQNSARQKA